MLIWKTILHVAKEKACDVIFVSGEEKSDWWHKSGGRQLYPRFELLDEFRRSSGGRSLYIVSLSELLAIYGVDQALVTEVRESERAEASADAAGLLARLPHSLREAVNELPYLEKLVYLQAEVEHLPHKENRGTIGYPSRHGGMALVRREELRRGVFRSSGALFRLHNVPARTTVGHHARVC